VTEADYQDALVLVLDTANQPRVDGEFWNHGATCVKIDHHPNDDAFGDPQWVDVDASSTSEMIYNWYAEFTTELTLSANAARLLYAGIVGDTGRFLYSATKPSTMRAAAALMEAGADAEAVNRIEDTITLPVARLSAYVYEHLTQLDSGAAYVILTNDILNSFEIGDASTAGVVPLPGRIDTVKCWAIFVQQKEGNFRIRLRSKGPSINGVAKLHDGGGHALASGAKAADQQEIETVVRELDQVATDYEKEV
jgi:phosphoesterase RecJ-like protein